MKKSISYKARILINSFNRRDVYQNIFQFHYNSKFFIRTESTGNHIGHYKVGLLYCISCCHDYRMTSNKWKPQTFADEKVIKKFLMMSQ